MAKAREQHALNMRDQRSEAKKSGFDSRFDEIHQSYRNNKKGQQDDEIIFAPETNLNQETQGEGNLPSQMLTESVEVNELGGQSFIGTTADNRLLNDS